VAKLLVMKKRRPRLDVDIPNSLSPKTRLYVDEDVANVLRKVARAERAELGPFLEMLLRHWLKTERPNWKIIDEDEGNVPARRG
jgi:hypothetical protein